jgi:hypothetical protein
MSATTGAARAARRAAIVDRADVRILESSQGLTQEVVVAAGLYRGHPLTEAGSESASSRSAPT